MDLPTVLYNYITYNPCMDCYVYCHMLSNFVIFSLTEQGVMQQRQEQKVNELTKKLETVEEKYQTVCQDRNRVKAKLTQTEAECVYSVV